MAVTLPQSTKSSPAGQCETILKTAGIQADVVAVPPLYLTVHVYSAADANTAHAILCLRDDLRFYRVRSFLDDSYVLIFEVR